MLHFPGKSREVNEEPGETTLRAHHLLGSAGRICELTVQQPARAWPGRGNASAAKASVPGPRM